MQDSVIIAILNKGSLSLPVELVLALAYLVGLKARSPSPFSVRNWVFWGWEKPSWFSLIWADSHCRSWWWMWSSRRKWEPPRMIRRAKPLIAVCHEVHKTQKELRLPHISSLVCCFPVKCLSGPVTYIKKMIMRSWPQDVTDILQLGKNISYFSPKKVLPLGVGFTTSPNLFSTFQRGETHSLRSPDLCC